MLDTSLCPCWVIDLFHWLKWKTSQVSKYLNMAMLQSEIFFLCIYDQSSHCLGSLSPKASKESTDVSCRRCRIWSRTLLFSFYWLSGLSQALATSSGKSVSLITTHKIFLPSWTTVSGGQGRACHITKCFIKECRDFLTVVPLCFFIGLQMSFHHITYQEWLQPWISFHKMMNSY